jgi:hypothetical protein
MLTETDNPKRNENYGERNKVRACCASDAIACAFKPFEAAKYLTGANH